MSYFVIGKPHLEISCVIGSYLLLNGPSIGFVWIMRVFLMMALILPFLSKFLKRLEPPATTIIICGSIVLQSLLIATVDCIDNKILHYVVHETVLYAFGYSAIAILGLKISIYCKRDLLILWLTTLVAIILFVANNNMIFDPQQYKYPPQSLYILYGIFGSITLWLLKPILSRYTKWCLFAYISKNSMWIYLWHIIPVVVLTPYAEVPNFWFGRYLIVLSSAFILNFLWHKVIELFPINLQKRLA